MRIHLVRHAHAGSRKAWDGADRDRPLSDRGWVQAEGIEKALADVGVDRVWSSAYVRCIQTLDPLAERLGLEVEVVEPLSEGGSGAEALDLLLYAARSGLTVAACSHGDVIPAVVATALGRGAQLDGQGRTLAIRQVRCQLAQGIGAGQFAAMQQPGQGAAV